MSTTGVHRSWLGRPVYAVSRQLVRLIGAACYHFRIIGREHWPDEGGALVCSNHQSYLDPLIIGCTCDRELNYMARKSLFSFGLFRWIIRLYNAFPVEREGIGIGGLKETLRRLKSGEMVLMFPEGTRTLDGAVHELQPGFCAVARRAGQPIVPLALAGAFEAWPRSRKWPRMHPITVAIGQPISVETIQALSDDALVGEVQRRIVECHTQARATMPSQAD